MSLGASTNCEQESGCCADWASMEEGLVSDVGDDEQ